MASAPPSSISSIWSQSTAATGTTSPAHQIALESAKPPAEDMGPEVECSICMEDVRVPVKLKAFGCQSCYDVKRVCVTCARRLLHLNTYPPNQRPYSIKCLFCPTTCDPRALNAKTAYEKDKMLMSLLKRKDYPCFHSDAGCAFKGNQGELDRHLQNACVQRMTRCDCGAFHKVVNAPEHYHNCRYHKQCPCCSEWKHVDAMNAHISDVHHSQFCNHCHKIYPNRTVAAHEGVCPLRRVPCEVCALPFAYNTMGEHLMSHVSERSLYVQGFVNQLKDAQRSLKKATDALDRFQFGDVAEVVESGDRVASEAMGAAEAPVRAQGRSRGDSGGGLLFRGYRWRPVSAFRTT